MNFSRSKTAMEDSQRAMKGRVIQVRERVVRRKMTMACAGVVVVAAFAVAAVVIWPGMSRAGVVGVQAGAGRSVSGGGVAGPSGPDADAAKRVALAFLDAEVGGDCYRARAMTVPGTDIWCPKPRILAYRYSMVLGPYDDMKDRSGMRRAGDEYDIMVEAKTPGYWDWPLPPGWTPCWVAVVPTAKGLRVAVQDSFM